jgi:hypothetical protein
VVFGKIVSGPYFLHGDIEEEFPVDCFGLPHSPA